MAAFIAWVSANYPVIITVLFGLSETLALIPSVKSNSVFQLVVNVIKTLKEKLVPTAAQ
jgi:hypothetical protein